MRVKYEIETRYQTDDKGELIHINGSLMREVINTVGKDYTILLDFEPDANLFFNTRSEFIEYLFFQNLFYQYGKMKRKDRTHFFPCFDVVKYLQRHEALNKADLERFINRQLDYYSVAPFIVFGQFADELKGIFRQLLNELEQKPITFSDVLKIGIQSDKKRIFEGQWIGSIKDAGIFLAKLKFFNHLTIEKQSEIIRLFVDAYNPKGSTSTLKKEMSDAINKLKENENQYPGIFPYMNGKKK